jgi:hypothetical protein
MPRRVIAPRLAVVGSAELLDTHQCSPTSLTIVPSGSLKVRFASASPCAQPGLGVLNKLRADPVPLSALGNHQLAQIRTEAEICTQMNPTIL